MQVQCSCDAAVNQISPVDLMCEKGAGLTCSFFCPRKGIECHEAIIMGLLDGMGAQNGDRVIFLDLVPNRQLGFNNNCILEFKETVF